MKNLKMLKGLAFLTFAIGCAHISSVLAQKTESVDFVENVAAEEGLDFGIEVLPPLDILSTEEDEPIKVDDVDDLKGFEVPLPSEPTVVKDELKEEKGAKKDKKEKKEKPAKDKKAKKEKVKEEKSEEKEERVKEEKPAKDKKVKKEKSGKKAVKKSKKSKSLKKGRKSASDKKIVKEGVSKEKRSKIMSSRKEALAKARDAQSKKPVSLKREKALKEKRDLDQKRASAKGTIKRHEIGEAKVKSQPKRSWFNKERMEKRRAKPVAPASSVTPITQELEEQKITTEPRVAVDVESVKEAQDIVDISMQQPDQHAEEANSSFLPGIILSDDLSTDQE